MLSLDKVKIWFHKYLCKTFKRPLLFPGKKPSSGVQTLGCKLGKSAKTQQQICFLFKQKVQKRINNKQLRQNYLQAGCKLG